MFDKLANFCTFEQIEQGSKVCSFYKDSVQILQTFWADSTHFQEWQTYQNLVTFGMLSDSDNFRICPQFGNFQPKINPSRPF